MPVTKAILVTRCHCTRVMLLEADPPPAVIAVDLAAGGRVIVAPERRSFKLVAAGGGFGFYHELGKTVEEVSDAN